jgi:carboxylesterase
MAQVIPGCEPWSADGGDDGALVLHGFTGNPSSMRPLAEALADQGFTVEMPRLPGHGTRWQELQGTTWHDWAREMVAAFERLRARTTAQVAVGLSMGGTLALHLAETRGDDLAGVVAINPMLHSSDPRLKALPVLKWAVPALPGIGNDIAKPGGDELPYPKLPLKALASFVALQRRVREDLDRVRVPTLVFTSRNDHVVEPENGTTVMEGISSTDAEQVWLEHSYHVATLDHDAEDIAARTAAFVARVCRGSAVGSGAPVQSAGPART